MVVYIAAVQLPLPRHLHHLGWSSRKGGKPNAGGGDDVPCASLDVMFTDPGVIDTLRAEGARLSGVTPDVVQHGRASCPPSRLFILHPGNPGVVHFYRRFCEHLSALVPEMAILVMGYPGQSLLCDADRHRVYCLQEQVELAEEFVGRIVLHRRRHRARFLQSSKGTGNRGVDTSLSSFPYPRGVYSGGHSIGAFLSLHVLARFRDDIRHSFQLAPTLCHMAQSPNGRDIMKRVVLSPPGIWAACTLLCRPLAFLLPHAVKRKVVKFVQQELDDDGADVVVRMMHPSVVNNVLRLASTEFRQVAALDVHLAASLETQLVFYFIPDDGWVPMSDVHLLRAVMKRPAGFIVEQPHRTKHAWCLQGPEYVADAVASFVNNDIGDDTGEPSCSPSAAMLPAVRFPLESSSA